MDGAPEIVVADIGNSAIKLAIASCDQHRQIELSSKLQWLHGEFDSTQLNRWAPRDEAHWCIASVHRSKTEMLIKWIAQFRRTHQFSELSYTDLPLKIAVEAPQRVGIDRLLTAVAANERRQPHRAAITITAGTAITVNAIGRDGQFLGGAILPGKPLLAKALHEYTDALPLVGDFASSEIEPIGKNTQDAIRSGIHFGLLGAVQKVIGQFQRELGDEAEIFIAGGDASSVHGALGLGTLVPDLVLEGAAIVSRSLLKNE